LTVDDVRILKTGYIVHLPRDQKGRTVLYADVSKRPADTVPSPRIIFFFGQLVMENEASRRCSKEEEEEDGNGGGFVLIRNISNPFAVDIPPANAQCIKECLASCMPIRPHMVHLLYISPPGMNITPLFVNTGM
jgi:hypothetical protein